MIVKIEMEVGKYISIAALTAYNDDGTPFIYRGNHYQKQYQVNTDRNITTQLREINVLLRGCRELKGRSLRVIIKSFSPYMENCLKSMDKWQQSGWKTAKGRDIKHKEEWQEIYGILKDYEVEVGE